MDHRGKRARGSEPLKDTRKGTRATRVRLTPRTERCDEVQTSDELPVAGSSSDVCTSPPVWGSHTGGGAPKPQGGCYGGDRALRRREPRVKAALHLLAVAAFEPPVGRSRTPQCACNCQQ